MSRADIGSYLCWCGHGDRTFSLFRTRVCETAVAPRHRATLKASNVNTIRLGEA
jgi:hypothetical protein